MDYRTTLDWMFSRLPMYQRQGDTAFKKDLTNIRLFCTHLQNPQNNFKAIHVAGTNGKGSTSHMLASILQESGLKVGLYTSPHLKDFRERIRVNGIPIDEQSVIEFIEENKPFLEQHTLSFFEMTVGMAFDHFAKEKVDIAVIEVGLGGRLDSTNMIMPILSVITNIGFDHMQFLGNTLPEIAFEKAGIIKKNTPVVISETQPETTSVFTDKAKLENAPIFFASDEKIGDYPCDLHGDYQKKNIAGVLKSVEILRNLSLTISESHIRNGLAHVISNTGLKGRWQVLLENPKVICDTAHNKEGLEIVLAQLKKEKASRYFFVLGFVKEKNLQDVLTLFPKEADYFFCKPDIPRGMDQNELQNIALQFGLIGKSYPSVIVAYNAALSKAGSNDLIYVGGSTFVVAEMDV
ncbi:bifunctional folylpolyglutamate synthase/dihydrofolate synthase [Namhaeicola litoreus]|uniref:Dihydrofolate synthase/folylpolyglutamate synthase n=1 Tax=Namhaeicola litoreus TaxID=1052145 RepID=A0ABW3Y1Z6_9FLAO